MLLYANIKLLIHNNISNFAKSLVSYNNYEMEFGPTSAAVNLAVSKLNSSSLSLFKRRNSILPMLLLTRPLKYRKVNETPISLDSSL